MNKLSFQIFVLFAFLSLSIIPSVYALPACTNNWVGGACVGSVTYTTNTILTSDVNLNDNVVINSGITLTTNTHAIIAGGTINGLVGTIVAGLDNSICIGPNNHQGNSITTSYGGSGGGGGGDGGVNVVSG